MDHIHRETLLRNHHDNIQSMDQSKETRELMKTYEGGAKCGQE